jgi:hypothetical protein
MKAGFSCDFGLAAGTESDELYIGRVIILKASAEPGKEVSQ